MISAKIEKPFMETQHLTYFKIQNFKRFDSLEVKNIGQFNLIVGDNNVGKTSLLEALLFEDDPTKLQLIYHRTLCMRGLHIHVTREIDPTTNRITLKLPVENYFIYLLKNIDKSLIIEFERSKSKREIIKLKTITGDKLSSSDRNKLTNIPIGINPKYYIRYYRADLVAVTWLEMDEMIDSFYIPFVRLDSGYDSDLINIYYETITKSRLLKDDFIKGLSFLIPKIEDVLVDKINDKEMLCVMLPAEDRPIPLVRFGDGAIKATRIILEIIKSKGKRLMIDEIETGLHFSRIKGFIKVIIQLCHKHQVQLFATTHSLECQQNFAAALEEESMKEFRQEVRNISMIETAKGEVETVTFDFEQFKYALEIGYNTRGGVNE